MMLAATPQAGSVTWVVALPEIRPFTITRSVDGGATWTDLTVISEAWTDDTFHDSTVSSNVFPLYALTLEG